MFAVSRAYYAMFYVAETFLLGQGLSFSRHSAVIAAFGERFAKPGIVPVEFHRYLIEGQDKRNVGDYQIGPGLTEGEAVVTAPGRYAGSARAGGGYVPD